MPETTPNAAPNVQAPHDAARDWARLSGRWGHQHSAPLPEGLLGLGARGQEPMMPGPTLAEVQAERDYERRRANEAIAQLYDARRELAAIAAALDADPERSPAWDDNDQPVPLPRRVEVALMPEGIGQSRTEKQLAALRALCPPGSIVIPPPQWDKAEFDGSEAAMGSATLCVEPHSRRKGAFGWVVAVDDCSRVSDGHASKSIGDAQIQALNAWAKAIGGTVVGDHSPDAGKKVNG